MSECLVASLGKATMEGSGVEFAKRGLEFYAP
jgi:hypothetical protein